LSPSFGLQLANGRLSRAACAAEMPGSARQPAIPDRSHR